MNTLEEKIQKDLVSAMKERLETSVCALRSVKTAIQNEKVNGVYHELSDNDIVKIIQKLVKQRQESIDIYSTAGRDELADKEQQEMLVLKNYLPKMLTNTELSSAIDNIIASVGAKDMKDMGKVMKVLAEKYTNLYDGKTASNYIKERLMQK